MILVAISGTTYWTIALVIGLVAALVVAALLVMLLMQVGRIKRSVDGLLQIAGEVGANTANIPQLEATAPVLAQIVDEAVIQDGYMNALTDGFSEQAQTMSTDLQIVLSVVLALVVVAVLAIALILIRRGLEAISEGLGTLATALGDVETQHLRPLEPAVKAINAQFEVILSALPGIARKAAVVAERRPR